MDYARPARGSALLTVRLDSHAEVTEAQTALLVEIFPRIDRGSCA